MERFRVRLAFLDVGQGDTIVVSIPEKQEAVVVDCADPDAVIAYLENQHIKHLRGLIITHLHLDHYKGAVDFLNNCERELGLSCERVLFNWPRRVSSSLEQLLRDTDNHSDDSNNEKINKKQRDTFYQDLKRWTNAHYNQFGALLREFDEGRLRLEGSVKEVIELLHPLQAHMDDLVVLNNESGILKIRGLNSSAILLGDLEFKGWQYLCSKPVDLRGDVLKFPHHGAWKDADPDLLLDVIEPSAVIISVGTQGVKYNHPNSHVLKAIAKRRHIRLLCTQVTEQCISDISKKSKLVKQIFEQNVTINTDMFYRDQYGCPCAGTIVIELGESATILQPEIRFHQDTIIKSHFHSHKCAI